MAPTDSRLNLKGACGMADILRIPPSRVERGWPAPSPEGPADRGDHRHSIRPRGGAPGLTPVSNQEHSHRARPLGTESNAFPPASRAPTSIRMGEYDSPQRNPRRSPSPRQDEPGTRRGETPRHEIRTADANLVTCDVEIHQTKPDRRWQSQRDEISRDIEKNRLTGRLTAQPTWGIRTIPSVHHPNTPLLV